MRDAVSGQVHFLNPTAAVVWECCDGRTSLAACVARLRASFTIPEAADIAADVRETVAGFRQKGLMDEPGASA